MVLAKDIRNLLCVPVSIHVFLRDFVPFFLASLASQQARKRRLRLEPATMSIRLGTDLPQTTPLRFRKVMRKALVSFRAD